MLQNYITIVSDTGNYVFYISKIVQSTEGDKAEMLVLDISTDIENNFTEYLDWVSLILHSQIKLLILC